MSTRNMDAGNMDLGTANKLKRLLSADGLSADGSIRPVLCDGAMGTMFYGGGVFINRCYDELNVSQPELVRGIHLEYPAGWRENY